MDINFNKQELSTYKIYVGQVGRAYVNVVSTYREWQAALKNVQDAQFIAERAVLLIEQCDDAIVDAKAVQDKAKKADTLIRTSINLVRDTIDALEQSYENAVGDNKAEIKEKIVKAKEQLQSLKALQSVIRENDTDFNLFNGGSIHSADENVKLLTDEENNSGALQIAEQVRVDALKLKDDNADYAVKCKKLLDDAQAEFEAWLTDDEDATQNDISDYLEKKYTRLLDKVEQILKDAEIINEAIEGTTDYINEKINEIMDGVNYKQYAKFRLSETVLNETVDMLSELSPSNGEEIAAYISNVLFNSENEEYIDIDENVYKLEFIQYPTGINSIGLKWTFETSVPGDNVVTNTRTILDILHPYADGIFVQGYAEDANLRLSVDAIALIKAILYAFNATQDEENPEYFSILTEKPYENSQETLDGMVVTVDNNSYNVLDAINDALGEDKYTDDDKELNDEIDIEIIRQYVTAAMGGNLPSNFVIDINDHGTCKTVSLFVVRNIITPNGDTLTDKASLVEIFSIYKNGIYVLPYSGNSNVQVSEQVAHTIDLFLSAINAVPAMAKGVYNIISTKKPDDIIIPDEGSTVMPTSDINNGDNTDDNGGTAEGQP